MMLEISRRALDAIRAHAASDPAHEACGLLLGSAGRIEAAEPTGNVAGNPARHFEIDPAALFRAIRAERRGGATIVGYYHSHPGGRAEPSAIDRAMAAPDGKIWVIVGADGITAWRATERGFDRVELRPV